MQLQVQSYMLILITLLTQFTVLFHAEGLVMVHEAHVLHN